MTYFIGSISGVVRFHLARRSVPIVDCMGPADDIYFRRSISTMLDEVMFRSEQRSVPKVELMSSVYTLVTIPGEPKCIKTVVLCEGSKSRSSYQNPRSVLHALYIRYILKLSNDIYFALY